MQNIKDFEKAHSGHTIITVEVAELGDAYKIYKENSNNGEKVEEEINNNVDEIETNNKID
ncbi:MAG: hypothetical protein BAJALOKI2v1_120039 [Promethearchaeota archaeon]|nr:MAG: hypothetical protein BAJALOKI2v1_120039 [Candidatus Lokiarchaeota archaeon]